MKSAYYTLLAACLTCSVSAAELTPERSVRLLMVNGVETESDTDVVNIESGFTQVAVKIFTTMGRGSNRQSFESNPFLLMFDAGEQDISIIAPEFTELSQAKKHFEGQPDIKLMAGGKELHYEYAPIEGKKGFLPYAELDKLIAKYNRENNIPIDIPLDTFAGENAVPDFEQLKEWYLKASAMDQEKFSQWIIHNKK